MAVQRKSIPQPPTIEPPPLPRRAEGGLNPALAAQRRRLESLLVSDDPVAARYPGVVRLAIVVGGTSALWAMAAAGAWRLITAP